MKKLEKRNKDDRIKSMNVGWTEIILILFVIMLLFGGKKLPELASGLGKAIREFKKALSSKELEEGKEEKKEDTRREAEK
jgi:sec-independent protein translocase protein TatA